MDMLMKGLARSFIPSDWSLIQKHSIEEVIWGYTDPVLERLKTFGQTDSTDFGFFMNQNDSKSFEIEAISGKKNVKETGKISSWNGQKDLSDVWFTPDAYTLQGSDSNSPMVPPLANASRLDIFVDLLCRSLYFERTEQSRVSKIKVDVYNVPLDELKKENNRGYWKKGLTNRDGMIDLSSCTKLTFGESAPLIASLPHFLYAAKNYENMYNVRPSIEKHSSFIKVEPMTGIILEAAKRFQLNTFVSRNFHPGNPANNSIIPAFWLSQSFSAVDHPGLLTKLGQQIRWLVLVTNFPLVLLVIAICGNLAAFFVGFKIHSQARQPRRLQARSLKEIGQLDASSGETLERQNLTTIS
ncbi:unnamed protein product [Oikopleura dioica]|uniref:Uncharacterized protein n=1 Tax=Oikopleura dioica TaxID=34765 RepID=E4XHB8_OIKDI|nr:unnamed protein product [Oikopleura dioica]